MGFNTNDGIRHHDIDNRTRDRSRWVCLATVARRVRCPYCILRHSALSTPFLRGRLSRTPLRTHHCRSGPRPGSSSHLSGSKTTARHHCDHCNCHACKQYLDIEYTDSAHYRTLHGSEALGPMWKIWQNLVTSI